MKLLVLLFIGLAPLAYTNTLVCTISESFDLWIAEPQYMFYSKSEC